MNNPMLFAAEGDPAVWLVIVMGVGIVFAGLTCIIGLCYLMSFVVNKLSALFNKNAPTDSSASAPAPVAPVNAGVIENRQEILAAVCAAVAEEEGTDISAIRVVSFKKI